MESLTSSLTNDQELRSPAPAYWPFALFLWIPFPQLRRLPELLKAWRFKYSTARCWVKIWPGENPLWLFPDSFAVGTAYEVRNSCELLVIAKSGRPERLGDVKPLQHIVAPRREHSRKPDCVRDELARLFAGPRCELFARSRHAGFDGWGNEIDKFESRP